MDFATLHKQRKFILIAAAAGLIGILLPWVSFLGYSINGFRGWGILMFLLFAGAGIISIMGDKTAALDKAMWLVTLVAGAIPLVYMIILMMDSSGGGFGVGISIGFWITLLASIGVVASAWLLKSPGDSLQGGFDSLKNKVSSNLNTTGTNSGTATSKMDELERLIKLREEGKITEEEYQQMKAKII